MNMQEHILSALKEQVDRWEALLATLSGEQVTVPHSPSQWSTKDEVVHLWAWQQRSIARLETARSNRAPDYPRWLAEVDPSVNDNTDQINDWIFNNWRDMPWSDVQANWEKGYRRFMELGGKITEKDLLDSDKYPWLNGHSLADTILSSYDHHQEHYDGVLSWLRENEKK